MAVAVALEEEAGWGDGVATTAKGGGEFRVGGGESTTGSGEAAAGGGESAFTGFPVGIMNRR